MKYNAATLDPIFSKLKDCKDPSSFYGSANGMEAEHKRILLIIHEDRYADPTLKARAKFTSMLLLTLHELAIKQIAAGTYGRPNAVDITIASAKKTYHASQLIHKGSIANIYKGEDSKGNPVVIKVPLLPASNALIKNEAKMIQMIQAHKDPTVATRLTPQLLDTFAIKDGSVNRQINVFEYTEGWLSLQQVKNVYPHGVDPRDMAWMFNRMLACLIMLKEVGIVHGGLTLSNMLIHPEGHNGFLIDFCYAVKCGERVKIKARNTILAPEIAAKLPADDLADIYSLSALFKQMLGNGPGMMQINNFLHGPVLKKSFRPTCLEVYNTFRERLETLYGPKRFREFNPKQTTN